MASWLMDYMEMTEYIPAEFRDQSFLMRELDLKVSMSMSEIDQEIKEFFEKLESLEPQERQNRYDALLKKCNDAAQAANDKVTMADRLHDLVEKSMRLLDQGLDKLKEELLEGDRAFIVREIERRSQEEEEQSRLEQEATSQRQHRIRDLKSAQSKNNTHADHANSRNSNSACHYQHSNPLKGRHNSTLTPSVGPGRQKKRERKRLSNAMTIFNRNSRTDDDSTNQTFLSSPSTPDYLVGMHSSNSSTIEEIAVGDNSQSMKGFIVSNKGSTVAISKPNGSGPIAHTRQPVLTAIGAAHAVSPNSTNGGKLGLYSSNGDAQNMDFTFKKNKQNFIAHSLKNQKFFNNRQLSQDIRIGDESIPQSEIGSRNSTFSSINHHNSNSSVVTKSHEAHNYDRQTNRTGYPFSSLPLSARHDPIMMAASQAINATQSMTHGRRTSSLRASYAAVNSGRLQSPTDHEMFDQSMLAPSEVYCKCRGAIQDPNMIACDNDDCKYEWFHYQCVGITTPPDGEWYCEDCRAALSQTKQA